MSSSILYENVRSLWYGKRNVLENIKHTYRMHRSILDYAKLLIQEKECFKNVQNVRMGFITTYGNVGKFWYSNINLTAVYKMYIRDSQKYTGMYGIFVLGPYILQEPTKGSCRIHKDIRLVQEEDCYRNVQNAHKELAEIYSDVENFCHGRKKMECH